MVLVVARLFYSWIERINPLLFKELYRVSNVFFILFSPCFPSIKGWGHSSKVWDLLKQVFPYISKWTLSNGACLVEQPNPLLHRSELYSLRIFALPIPGKLEISWNYNGNEGICSTIIHKPLSLLFYCSKRDS